MCLIAIIPTLCVRLSELPKQVVKYSASCSSDRFKDLVTLVTGEIADEPDEWKSSYIDETNELFAYHWDTQKSAGKKYNLSWGLINSEEKAQVDAKSYMFTAQNTYYYIHINLSSMIHAPSYEKSKLY